MSRWTRYVRNRKAAVTATYGVTAGLAVAGIVTHVAYLLIAAVITGLVAIPVSLRIVRGSVAVGEMRYLAKLQLNQKRKSRHLRRAMRNHELVFEGERFVVELRRHPVTMVSPVLIFTAIAVAVKGIGHVLVLAIATWPGRIVALIVIGSASYTYKTDPFAVYVILWIALGIVLLAALLGLTLWIRHWLLQSYVFTTKHVFVFPGRNKPPVRYDLPKAPRLSRDPDLVTVYEPGGTTFLSRFRFLLAPLGNVVLYRISGTGRNQRSVRVVEITDLMDATVLKREGLFTGGFPPPIYR